jgi:acyl-CoA synthetase (AMP-forming)/AMP-acid ligase II
MMPSDFYYEDVLPKNPNGKVDRKFLNEKYKKIDNERRMR